MALTLGPTGTRYGAKLSIDWTGFDEVRANLKTIAERYPVEMGLVLREECVMIMDKSLQLCPFDQDNSHDDGTPHLNETGQVEGPIHSDYNTYCILSYNTPYAVLQHEVQEYHHDAPEQWKYLEQPINDRAPFIAANMARGVNLERMKEGYIGIPTDILQMNMMTENAGRMEEVRQNVALKRYGHLMGRFR